MDTFVPESPALPIIRDTSRFTHCVLYRVGGYARWEWRSTPRLMPINAEFFKEGINRQGYHCFITTVVKREALGLPKSFDVDELQYTTDDAKPVQ